MALATIIRDNARSERTTPAGFYATAWGLQFSGWHRVKGQALAERVATLLQRYHRYLAYRRDVAPRWVETRIVHYADNSTESEQACGRHNGEHKRTVMLVAPHGDLCF